MEGAERERWEGAVSVVTTEHSALVGARATAISDSSARASLFLGAVSSSLVALAFVGQAQHFGPIVKTFAFVLLPTLVFLGVVTFARALEDAGQDQLYVRAINRLRRYYTDVYPHTRAYFTFAGDVEHPIEITSSGGVGWERHLTTPTSVGVINCAIFGVFIGLLVTAFGKKSDYVAVTCGVTGAMALLGWNAWYQTRYWRRFEARIAERYADRTIAALPTTSETPITAP